MADLKAALAELGQTVMPNAELIYRPKSPEVSGVVVLDRVVKDHTPDYCVHGYATCARCHAMVWLGHETVRVVSDGVAPLCLECACDVIPADAQPYDHLADHRRADGPH